MRFITQSWLCAYSWNLSNRGNSNDCLQHIFGGASKGYQNIHSTSSWSNQKNRQLMRWENHYVFNVFQCEGNITLLHLHSSLKTFWPLANIFYIKSEQLRIQNLSYCPSGLYCHKACINCLWTSKVELVVELTVCKKDHNFLEFFFP